MNKREELQGFINETVKPDEIRDDIEKLKEEQSKYLEQNKEYKAQLDSLQDKTFKLQNKQGAKLYRFKGYNPDMNKNFKGVLTEDEAEQVAKVYLDMAHGKAIDFASEMPTEFGSTVMGLAELRSSALSTMNVLQADGAL